MRKQLIALALAAILIGGLYAQDNPKITGKPNLSPGTELNEQMPPCHTIYWWWMAGEAEEFKESSKT